MKTNALLIAIFPVSRLELIYNTVRSVASCVFRIPKMISSFDNSVKLCRSFVKSRPGLFGVFALIAAARAFPRSRAAAICEAARGGRSYLISFAILITIPLLLS
jgi:hypothetical protein